MIAETRSMQGWGGQGRAARAGQGRAGQGRGIGKNPNPCICLAGWDRAGQGEDILALL